MKENYLFINSIVKDNKVLIPSEITINTNKILGIYLDTCIRLYKEEKNFQLIKDPSARRIVFGSLQNFEIKNNYISLSTKDRLINEYDFSDGVIIVDSSKQFDIVEKNNLKKYMDNYYFKSKYKDIVLGNEKTIMTRYSNGEPKTNFKLLTLSKKTINK